MIDEMISLLAAYIEIGVEFIASHIFTIEGVVALMFGFFFLGLISRIRSL